MRFVKHVRHVPAALALAWALLPASAGATGIVLTGGGGGLDLASLAGLVMLAGVARRPKRVAAFRDDARSAPRRSSRWFVMSAIGCALLVAGCNTLLGR